MSETSVMLTISYLYENFYKKKKVLKAQLTINVRLSTGVVYSAERREVR
jgi:hypothetical protein